MLVQLTRPSAVEVDIVVGLCRFSCFKTNGSPSVDVKVFVDNV